MTHTLTPTPREQSIRVPVLWGLVPGAAPVRPCSRPWAMFAATVVAMPSQDDSHVPARRSFASKRAG